MVEDSGCVCSYQGEVVDWGICQGLEKVEMILVPVGVCQVPEGDQLCQGEVFARGKEEVKMIVVPVEGCQVHRGELQHSTGVGLVT